MGIGYQHIADVDAGADEALALGESVAQWLVSAEILVPTDVPSEYEAGPRGVEMLAEPDDVRGYRMTLVTERTVFHPGAYIGDDIGCPHCGELVELNDITETVGQWYDGGDGLHGCTGCARSVHLNDWQWDPSWAFGHLGFTFESWPPLRPGFVQDIATRLGHRVVLVDCYL